MSITWLNTTLPTIEEIQRRLAKIFPREVDVNGYIIREMGAKTVYTMLYGLCVGGEAWIRPSDITVMTDEQASILSLHLRKHWLLANQGTKSAPRDVPGRWYKPNTREPLRDETLREMVRLNAVLERPGLPTTSPRPRYSLQTDFAELFNPSLQGTNLETVITHWQDIHLSASALARLAISKRMATGDDDGVLIQMPSGETRKLVPGPSSELVQAVIEQFSKLFLITPAVILISESARKLTLKDDELCRAIGFKVDVSAVLPDIILADLGQAHPIIVFIECVASDGPINDRRKEQLIEMAKSANYTESDCAFVTVFKDRSSAESRKLLPSIAWGTFVWYATEPAELVYLRKGIPEKMASLGDLLNH